METFNDEKLLNLAKNAYYTKDVDTEFQNVETLFKKTVLTNPERNKLVSFLESVRSVLPMSMSQMKKEILHYIGFKEERENYYATNTVGRPELAAIYKFIMDVKRKETSAKSK